ncbi:SMC domain-containing protein [Salinisphaera hydrothermalis C27AD]
MQGRWSLDTARVEDEGDRHDMALRVLRQLSLLQLQDESTSQLTFSRGSVLFKLAEETLELNGALADASRAARSVFGDTAESQLKETLEQVRSIAGDLGIGPAVGARATLDASQVTLRPGNIALHDQAWVPLTRLGLGSSRLLIAGLQQKAKSGADIGLIDELESGLEPHRIVRLLQALGAKQPNSDFQVFATTHSPVVVRELSAEQLLRVCNIDGVIETPAIDPVTMQGPLRLYPEAFLSQSVIVCEGAGEVGLLRGLDHYRIGQGLPSLTASGTALIDARGVGNILKCAKAFHQLGYRVAILRDDDAQPDAEQEKLLVAEGCELAKWPNDHALEHAVFLGLPGDQGLEVVRRMIDLFGRQSIEQQINNHLPQGQSFGFDMADLADGELTDDQRHACVSASMAQDKSWLKRRGIGVMEEIACDVIGPALDHCQPWMREEIDKLFDWADDA